MSVMSFVLFRKDCFEGAGELVGTGGGFGGAAYAFETADDIRGFHSSDERADTLKVAVAPADETDIADGVVLDFNLYCA